MNLEEDILFFWDGKASSLEEQLIFPIENPIEMNLPIDSAVARLLASPFYLEAFDKVYHQKPSIATLANAIAQFERSLVTSHSPFDDWRLNDNQAALSSSAKRGFILFNGKAKCIKCHFGPNFNNTEFRNIGLFDGQLLTDSGRAAVTHQVDDIGKFKIGPLRNVALTAPYMHNGMFKDLTEVIAFYNDPDKIVPGAIGRDSLLSEPLLLTEVEQEDLVHFLESLTSLN